MDSKNFDKFVENARSIHGYKYEYLNYTNMRTHIVLSLKGKTMSQCPKKHLMGRCPEKATEKRTQEDFIKESIDIWDNRFNYSETEYSGSLNKVIFYDNRGFRYQQRASSHLDGVEPKIKAKTDYSDDKNTLESKNEIIEFLKKNKIEYIQNYKFIDINSVKGFAFYIPSIRKCIEFYSQNDYEKDCLKIDNNIKINYCEDNYIGLLQLSYKQKNILWELLWENFKKKV